MQDFLNWLQEESGYKAEEKKTILQRITEWLSDIIEAIRDIMNSGELNGAGKLFAKENCDELVRIRKQFLEALDGAGANYRESGAVEGDVRFSFKNTKTGMANDKLLPYDEELTAIIEQKGGYIVDSFDKLKNIVNIAYDNPQLKATAYFGIVSPDVLSNIENHIHNLPKELEGKLFKQGQSYSVAATLDSIKHLSDEKALTKQDVIDYLDRMSDTIIDFDSVNFDYYYQGKEKSKGIVFKKTFADGTMQSFEIVSNKKRSLNLQTIYMQKGDYKKKEVCRNPADGKTLSRRPRRRSVKLQ